MSESLWIFNEYDKEISGEISSECEISKPIANVLVGRGFNDLASITQFIEKPTTLLRNFKNLPDVKPAVERLKRAIEDKEKIFIWGDYDVDGITATAVVVTCMNLFGANIHYKVPSRFSDGYDIKKHSVDECIENGCSLLMTVDCGILAFETAEYAKTKNLDLLITDHHTPSSDGRVPDCLAVVNPSRLDSEYGFSGLCGAGIAFKLMLALGKALNANLNKIVLDTIEYVALGTVADVAPMIDENRVLVHKGCQTLSNSKKIGIQELLKVAGVSEVDTTSIGFQLGPRINAIGRLADPQIAVDLLLETNPQRAKFLANQLDSVNKRRQSKQEHMVQEAFAMAEEENLDEFPIIVCWAKSWHAGLIGLVAGKLAEKYHKPAIVFAVNEEGNAKGSCRSTKTINILEILKHPDVLPLFSKKGDGSPIVGGHAFAAGMEVPLDNLKQFRQATSDVLTKLNPNIQIGKKTFFIDSRIVAGEINEHTYNDLLGLAPFGAGNPEPVFMLKGILVQEQKLLSSDKHIKFSLFHKKFQYNKLSALLWHRAADYPDDYVNKTVDIIFTFGKENKSYGTKFYLSIIDMKLSE